MNYDKVKREIISPKTDSYAGFRCYILNVAEGLQNSDTRTFREAFESRWSQRWLKIHTCGLVKLLKQEKVITIKWMRMARSRFKRSLNLINVVEQWFNMVESSKWLMVKLASPRFQVKVEIVEVCIKILNDEEKENMFWNCRNPKLVWRKSRWR